jgi:predicted nucleic acid-binding protein
LRSAGKALCDAGPLVALFDPRDAEHARCRTALDAFGGRLLTTWPVLTEACHFLSRFQQPRLWDFMLAGGAIIADLFSSDLPRLRALMSKYADLPMDLADASLVVIAERLSVQLIFTLDAHFQVYRLRGARSLQVAP